MKKISGKNFNILHLDFIRIVVFINSDVDLLILFVCFTPPFIEEKTDQNIFRLTVYTAGALIFTLDKDVLAAASIKVGFVNASLWIPHFV